MYIVNTVSDPDLIFSRGSGQDLVSTPGAGSKIRRTLILTIDLPKFFDNLYEKIHRYFRVVAVILSGRIFLENRIRLLIFSTYVMIYVRW